MTVNTEMMSTRSPFSEDFFAAVKKYLADATMCVYVCPFILSKLTVPADARGDDRLGWN